MAHTLITAYTEVAKLGLHQPGATEYGLLLEFYHFPTIRNSLTRKHSMKHTGRISGINGNSRLHSQYPLCFYPLLAHAVITT
jgi:hypothetical protein